MPRRVIGVTRHLQKEVEPSEGKLPSVCLMREATLTSVSGGLFSVAWGESGPPTLLGVRVI